eukprot:TRINITY_DN71025_c0_g1_i1.p1 TRINITY_DN71025_c0_g1~~TRINITY_DN71025_c0_g1_i1.p1  ORF type:complete len:303 (+),score=44.57 TRINITY_DN71025_c0_g1_i1:80-988(+)
MFARADRTFLNDANRGRHSCQPPANCNEPQSPPPTAYNPPSAGPRGPRGSTRRFLFSKSQRRGPGHEDQCKNVPGPGAYQPAPPTTFRPIAHVPRQPPTERRRLEQEHLADAGVPGPEVRLAQHSALFTVSRVPRLLNMIDGVNSPHTLKQYSCQRSARPGPADYEMPPLWHSPQTARTESRRGLSPRAVMPRAGRTSSAGASESPGPSHYEPVAPSSPCRLGTLERTPRGVEKLPTTEAPGPGAYYVPATGFGQLRMQVPQASRQIGRMFCGVDLKKARKLPGPASYHPIHDNMVRQPYTV